MAKQTVADKYGQIVVDVVAELVAGTGYAHQISSNISTKDKIGMLIKSVDYNLAIGDWEKILDHSDSISGGLLMWNVALSSISYQTSGVLDRFTIEYFASGAGTLLQIQDRTIHRDFSTQQGGGLFVHPSSLYTWVRGVSLASAVTLYTRIHYITVPLSDSDYQELFQMQIINAITSP